MVRKRTILSFSVLIILIAVITVMTFFTDLKDYRSQEKIRETIQGSYFESVAIFILLVILLKLIFIPTPISLAGGYAFGSIFGTMYTVTGITISSLISFFAARILGRKFVKEITENKFKKVTEYNEKIRKHGFLVVLFFRVVPLLPYLAVNMGFGVTNVKTKDFVIGTVIGAIPGAFLLANIGNYISDFTDIKLYIFAALYILLVAATGYWGYKKR